MAGKAAKEVQQIDVLKIEHQETSFCILGSTPMILQRMSQKVMRELLMPKGRKTQVEKASNLKHDPLQEFRDAPYLNEDPKAPTYIEQLATCFKKALQGAALDMPGANKSQIGRLTWVNGEKVAIYGTPQIFCSVTRSADMNRTPDVRTRCIVPNWAAFVTVSFVTPILKEQAVANLLASAGITQGIGDWRPQKGSGTYGQFELVSADDPRFLHAVKHGGRKVQEIAMRNPQAYDRDTTELLEWFREESKKRGFSSLETRERGEEVAPAPARGKKARNGNGAHAGA